MELPQEGNLDWGTRNRQLGPRELPSKGHSQLTSREYPGPRGDWILSDWRTFSIWGTVGVWGDPSHSQPPRSLPQAKLSLTC